MAREETFLERRGRMKQERDTNPDQYAKSLAAGRDQAAKSSMMASSRTLSASKATKKPKSELMQQMDKHRERIEGKQENKERADRAEGRRNKAREEGKAARERTAQVKFDTKTAEQSDTNMKALHAIFKDQTNRIIEAIKKSNKDQLAALKKLEGNGGGNDGSMFDLIDDDGPDRRKRRGGRGGRGGRGRPHRRISMGTRLKFAGKRALGAGQRVLGAVSGVGSRLATGASNTLRPAAEMGGRALSSAGRAAAPLGSIAGVAKAAGPLALLAGGVQAYNTVTDDTKTNSEKAQGVANVAGGTAGGILGAQLGAAAGTAIFPVVGTAVGGIVGGVAGYFAGEKFINSIGTAFTETVTDSKFGEIMGKGAAVAMAPFSEDARMALSQDWQQNILPAMSEMFSPMTDLATKLGDYTKALGDAGSEILSGAKSAAGSIWAGVRRGAGAVAEGYKKDGLTGAARSLGTAAGEVRKGASQGYGQVSDAVKLAGKTLGAVSEKYESGGRGVNTISSGQGDHGGVSYGKHQLATKNGSMAQFLKSAEGAPIAAQLQGLQPGTKEFNDRYQQLTAKGSDTAKQMEDAQHAYIQRTHFNPQAAKLQADLGLDVSKRGKAVQEAVWSTSVQHGGDSSLISKALKGKDVNSMSDKDMVTAIQDYKAANVDTNFRSSSAETRESIRKRVEREKADLVAIAELPKDGKKVADTGAKATKADTMGTVDPAPAIANKGKASVHVAHAQTNRTAVPQLSQPTPSTAASKAAEQSTPTVAFAAPSTSSTANARPAPVPMVNANTPTEPQSMARIAAAESTPPQVSGGNTIVQGGQQPSSAPTLAEIPMYINDMGLVLLNIGHV